MSTKDKLSGRLKKAAGDLLGDRWLRMEGVKDERKPEGKEQLERKEQALEHQAALASDLQPPTTAPPPE